MATNLSLQERLERLSPEQRKQVDALLDALEQSPPTATVSNRQPGGLRGAMHTHDDFDAPMGEEFLIP